MSNKNLLDKIKELIPSLPNRDIQLGYDFLNKRDFESLKDLIDSAIYKVEKNIKSNTPKEEYTKVNLDELIELKLEVSVYLNQLYY
jgi:hypothetical protein